MWKGRNVWEHMIEKAAHDSEPVSYQTILEIAGDRRILIENHRGIISYGTEKITVNVKYGSVSICGNGLEIIHMTKEHLVIFGRIHSVSLNRRDKI